jgi:hypothetical protein
MSYPTTRIERINNRLVVAYLKIEKVLVQKIVIKEKVVNYASLESEQFRRASGRADA